MYSFENGGRFVPGEAFGQDDDLKEIKPIKPEDIPDKDAVEDGLIEMIDRKRMLKNKGANKILERKEEPLEEQNGEEYPVSYGLLEETEDAPESDTAESIFVNEKDLKRIGVSKDAEIREPHENKMHRKFKWNWFRTRKIQEDKQSKKPFVNPSSD